ncbi:fimbrial protein [Parabacteroides sp. ASD2025]|uniref:fimbrial protein n=1 Tax=Parabacteroides sp. ASD2025 TaxID=3415987 RepID=UPI003CFA77C2
MKFRSYFLLSIVVGAAFACSSDDDIPEVHVFTPDATLSLTAGTGEKETKANASYDTSNDAMIHRLQMFVFSGTGDNATYQTSKDTVLTNPATSAKLEDLPVQSGSASLLVLANYPKISVSNSPTLSDIIENTASLEQEGNNGYTMSSQVYDITIVPGKHNIMGASSDFSSHTPQASLSSDPVVLVRNVAKINLVSLTLKTKNDDGSGYVLPDGSKPVSFELDSIFVSNVKSASKIASNKYLGSKTDNNNWAAVETDMDGTNQWWFGAFNTDAYNDTLSKVSGEQKDLLLYNVVKAVEEKKWDKTQTLTTTNTTIEDVNGLGKSFLVYENMSRNKENLVPLGEQTILVVCGRYTRKFDNGAQVTEHGYYAVPVNNKEFGAETPTGVAKHEFIKRNVKYNIALTIASTGSSTPYGWDVYAHAAAIVKVMPWNVVEINEGVD